MRRSCVVGALAIGLIGLGVTPAGADGGGGDWPKGRGPFVPAPPDYYQGELTFEACGGETFTITSGDVRKAKFRTTELDKGRTLDEYRGPETIDITRDDGVLLDELEVGGYSRTLTTPREDGTLLIREQLFGESLLFPFTPEDTRAFERAFGTDFAYFEDKNESVTLKLLVDTAEGEEAVPEILNIEVRADIIDLCEVFDELAEGGDGNGRKGSRNGDKN